MAMHSQHTRLHWEVSALAEVAAESACQHSHKLTTCAEIEALARKLWGESVSVAHHGSTHSGASLRGSDLDVVLCKIRDLPKPDNPGGNGYLVHSREMVASYLDSLKKCVPVVICGSGGILCSVSASVVCVCKGSQDGRYLLNALSANR